MDYKLTAHRQYSHRDSDGKCRNHISFFLNDVLILKQKIPFDTNWERGFDRKTAIYDCYLLNGRLYQKRVKHNGCGSTINAEDIREVYYPVSKKLLAQFNIPKDFKVLPYDAKSK